MTPQQTRKLRAKLREKHIRSREVEGTTIHYLEGWHVIAEANRIFGFDGWDRETVDDQCVYAKANGSMYSAAYVTRIRIRVRDGIDDTIREGSGAGEATAPSPGRAHELAKKAAETDATKRALMTFGNPFGLSLYANSRQRQVPGVSTSPENGSKPEKSPKTGDTNSNGAALPPDARANADQAEIAGEPSATGSVDKSALTIAEPKRNRDKAHLRFVASRYCLVCGRNRAQAHHLKFAQSNGMGIKTSDEFTVPLCSTHHRELHQSGNERTWWKRQGIDPEKIAKELWEASRQKR